VRVQHAVLVVFTVTLQQQYKKTCLKCSNMACFTLDTASARHVAACC
jgi:hypothetical protein